jgi:hypothetical protein
MRLFRMVGALGFALALSSCAAGLPGLRPLSYATPGEARLFVSGSPCIHEPKDKEAVHLAAAFLVGAASRLLENFGAALTAGAQGGELPRSVSVANTQLRPGDVPQCLVVVRGSFAPSRPGEAPIDLKPLLWDPNSPDAEDDVVSFEALHIPAVYRLDHYIELKIDSTANGKALTFAPVFARLERSLDGSREGKRDLAMSVRFARVGAEGVGGAVNLADRRIGSEATFVREPNGRYPFESPWFGTFHQAQDAATGGVVQSAAPRPAATAAANRAGGGPRVAVDAAALAASDDGIVGGAGVGPGAARAAIGDGRGAPRPDSAVVEMQSRASDAVPVTITVTVVETRPTREGLAFVAAVFNGARPAINEAIKPVLDPSARSAAAAQEATTNLTAQADLATAFAGARTALIAYCEGASDAETAAGRTDRITKSAAARTAQIRANVAAVAAEVAQPFPVLVAVGEQKVSAGTIGCAAQ